MWEVEGGGRGSEVCSECGRWRVGIEVVSGRWRVGIEVVRCSVSVGGGGEMVENW